MSSSGTRVVMRRLRRFASSTAVGGELARDGSCAPGAMLLSRH
jgi:hypothetical protein